MLKKIRISLAIVFFLGTTLLFLDFTGSIHAYLGWMAKVQFLPSLLALNVGVVIALLALTALFGRVYCSVICPLGVMQDVFSRIGGKFKKNRFKFSPAKSWLRYSVLAIFVVAFLAGIGSLVALISPYSAYGRIASNLFAPIYQWGNNIIAGFAERSGSYIFYSVDIWIRGLSTLIVAAVTFVIIGFLSVRHGRTYCNTICPVGTILGLISKFSLYKPTINTDKCNGCTLCARQCKASCINTAEHKIDYSRCVACFDCLDICKQGAIQYKRRGTTSNASLHNESQPSNNRVQTTSEPPENDTNSSSRRNFAANTAVLALGVVALQAQGKVDGGLTVLPDKIAPKRKTKLVPPGAQSLSHFHQNCTACQLCVSVCPNHVLRASDVFGTDTMHPYMSFEDGYCRPECTKCSEVCPTGAITKITKADKSAIKIGTAVWNADLCVVNRDDVDCDLCERHCPTGAIISVKVKKEGKRTKWIPTVNAERCIGCGACENLCPSRPKSAIYVEGIQSHREI